MTPLRFTILGQAASKSNSRDIVKIGGKPRSIKSKEARAFKEAAVRQIPPALRLRLQGPIALRLDMYYRTELPDMDEQLLLDALQDQFAITRVGNRMRRDLVQGGVFCNDRQVRWRLCIHHIDRTNPRVEVVVASLAPTQDMFALLAPELELPF